MKWAIQHNAAKRSISILSQPDESGHIVEIEIPEKNEYDAVHIATSLALAKAVPHVLVTTPKRS